MDIAAFIAERKIEAAMEDGAFDALPSRGFIDCSLHGEAFLAKWFREHVVLSHEEAARTKGNLAPPRPPL